MPESRIIIITNGQEEYACDLKRLFEFMGKAAQICHKPEQWQSQLAQPGLDLICITANALPQITKQNAEFKATLGNSYAILISDDTSQYDETVPNLVREQLSTPFQYDQLEAIILNAEQQQTDNNAKPQEQRDDLDQILVGQSRAIRRVRQMIRQVAKSDVNVLILGHSGTGKELVSQAIHKASSRQSKSFVPVNCGAIPAELLESELFGHEKGAFTGAICARQGRFELAQGGTLFLDEIGDMPLPMQVKLLRVLQERVFERVGSNRPLSCDVRIIAATHRNLESLIENGDFREDLFYRLNVFPIEMPSLAERSEDIPLLVQEITTRIQSEGRGLVRFTKRALKRLQTYSWPGNVRELANLLERLTVSHANRWIDIQHLPHKFLLEGDIERLQQQQEYNDNNLGTTESDHESDQTTNLQDISIPKEGIDLKAHLTEIESNLIQSALAQSNGIVAHAAKSLSIRRTTLVEKIRKLNLNTPTVESIDTAVEDSVE